MRGLADFTPEGCFRHKPKNSDKCFGRIIKRGDCPQQLRWVWGKKVR